MIDIKKNFFSSLRLRLPISTARLFLLFLPLVFLPAPVYAVPVPVRGSYIIQLSALAFLPGLSEVATNLIRDFKGVTDSRFQNIYQFDSTLPLAALKDKLKGDFAYLEALQPIAAANIIPNDPGFSPDPANIDEQWGLVKAGFDQAWEKTTGSASNVVAIIDTGVDATHEDLKTITYVSGYNFLSNQSIYPGSNSDDNGHGTLMAGILGATANNSRGIAGTNWQLSVMPIKALDAQGKGDAGRVAEAIVWAADHGAQFINLSVGGVGFGQDTTLSNAVAYAFHKNAVIVAAAGNDVATTGGNLDDNPVFPICDDNNLNMVIGVTATDQNDLKTGFANYGKNCIDVTAPGKRILSTINYDPVTGNYAPSSYAYASGSSLGVPFVIGQAMLIKTLFPDATNAQIRDRIISTADPIDNLNLSQCGGGSCKGLLGAGRINVPKSLEAAIGPQFSEGDLIKVSDLDNAKYQILGGQKRLISSFVYNQRFLNTPVKTALYSQLSAFPQGPYVTPVDGTLVKYDASPTVYIIQNGQKLPVIYPIFKQKAFSFLSVNTLSVAELDSWVTGSFLPPNEGTLLRAVKNKTVYWVVGQVLHPINFNFFIEKGLNVFPVLTVPDADINGFAKGEAYIR